MLGSLGFMEIIFILVLALLIFGPRKLPEIGRTLGRGLAEFRRASTELTRTLNLEVSDSDTTPAKSRAPRIEPSTSAKGPVRSSEDASAVVPSEPAPSDGKAPEATVPRTPISGAAPAGEPVAAETAD